MTVNLLGKGILKFLLWFALFCLVWSAVLLILINFVSEDTALIVFLVGVFVTYLPFFFLTASVKEKGQGEPAAIEQIRREIESINAYDVPVTVEKKSENKYMLTWRYADAKWYGMLSKSSMKQSYQLVIKLNDAKKQATLIDIHKSIRWRVGTTKFRLSGGYFRGIKGVYERGAAWGIRENFTLGKIYDYEFTAGEIRNPVVNTLLRSGWDVRFATW